MNSWFETSWHPCNDLFLPDSEPLPYEWTIYFAHMEYYFHSVENNTWSVGPGYTLPWRHNDHDGVSNHQPHGCLLNRLFRCRSKKTSKLRVTGLCVGNSPGPVNSPHKRLVTRKMFPFDDVIMIRYLNLITIVPPGAAFTNMVQLRLVTG